MTKYYIKVLVFYFIGVNISIWGQIDNDLINPDEIYDVEYVTDSNVSPFSLNATSYYCVFRSNFNTENHPVNYPQAARWGDPIMFSHTNQFLPFLKDRPAPFSVEQIAEQTLNDRFKDDLTLAGMLVNAYAEASGFFINQEIWDDNFVYLPPLPVDRNFPFISATAGLAPSPDWFTMLYLFPVIDEFDQTYWDSFKILSYPWDAGTDDGQGFTSMDQDTDPPGVITRIDVDNTVNDIFLSPDKDEVRHVAEWECVLHTCPTEEPDCVKPDWPPANGCDVLSFPDCVADGTGADTTSPTTATSEPTSLRGPTAAPNAAATINPTLATTAPTSTPTTNPTLLTLTMEPTVDPTLQMQPTSSPESKVTTLPTKIPSSPPPSSSLSPTSFTMMPTITPTILQTITPTGSPVKQISDSSKSSKGKGKKKSSKKSKNKVPKNLFNRGKGKGGKKSKNSSGSSQATEDEFKSIWASILGRPRGNNNNRYYRDGHANNKKSTKVGDVRYDDTTIPTTAKRKNYFQLEQWYRQQVQQKTTQNHLHQTSNT